MYHQVLRWSWIPTLWMALADTTPVEDGDDSVASSSSIPMPIIKATTTTWGLPHRGAITMVAMVAAAPSGQGGAATVGVDGRLCVWKIPKNDSLPVPSARIIDAGAIVNLERADVGATSEGKQGGDNASSFQVEPVTVSLHTVAWSRSGNYIAVGGEQGNAGSGIVRVWNTSASSASTVDVAAAGEVQSPPTKRSTSLLSRSSSPSSKQASAPPSRLSMGARVAVLMGRKATNTATEDIESGGGTERSGGDGDDTLAAVPNSLIGGGGIDSSEDWWSVPPAVLDGGHTVGQKSGTVYCVAFGPTGTMLASGGAALGPVASKRGASGQVIIWQVVAGGGGEWKQLMVLGHGGDKKSSNDVLPSAVHALAFGPTGRRIATAGGVEGATSVGDNVVRVWDLVQKKVALTIPLEAEAGGAVGLDFAPSGRGLAVAFANGDIRVYSVEGDTHAKDNTVGADASLVEYLRGGSAPPRVQGSVLLRFSRAHPGGATGVAFGSNGEYLFSIGLDGCVRAWSIANANPAAIFPMAATAGAGGGMGPIAVAPDGYGVIAGDASGAAYIMQLQGAREDHGISTVKGAR